MASSPRLLDPVLLLIQKVKMECRPVGFSPKKKYTYSENTCLNDAEQKARRMGISKRYAVQEQQQPSSENPNVLYLAIRAGDRVYE